MCSMTLSGIHVYSQPGYVCACGREAEPGEIEALLEQDERCREAIAHSTIRRVRTSA